ncbi:hypothetical protein GCM10023231_01850 [Olivibacter ginsenosidimutans]|uniref:TFIIB-type zinc ribbon-containing protein n=1 Tax=Olivibacter ginsenosidimutans TaxID=1176537 RepID=A0ABP9ADZ6_9SPHI
MAKRIKAIKCPHCGSIENTQLKDDYYRCNSCGTEYFLDNDDVNINYTYRYEHGQRLAPETKKLIKTISIIIGGLFLFFVIINIVGALVGSRSNSKPIETNVSTSYAPTVPKVPEKKYYWYSKSDYFFEDANHKLVYVLVGVRRLLGGASDDGNVLAIFYDVQNKNKELAKSELPLKSESLNTRFREFENGDLYFIVDNKRLFKINRNDKLITEITAEKLGEVPELHVGFAKIEFAYESEGDGFRILTNEGKQVFYYPITGKVYDKDALYRAQGERASIPKDTPIRTAFKFSDESFEYPDEKLQLIQYRYRSPMGYPKNEPHFRWSKDFGGSGIFTERDPYKKVLINSFQQKRARIIDFKDFTPGRLYFSASVLDFNDKYVLISFKPTPAEDETCSVQLLDAKTAAIIWTYATDKKYVSAGHIMTDGYRIDNELLGADGKVKQTLTIPD